MHLLLVDDEPSAIHALAHCLSDLGELFFATSGAQALALARQQPPDLVLLDAHMPGLSGFETCAAFKSDPTLEHIPILFVTSERSPEVEAAVFELGAVDYLNKPVRPVVVRARVRTQLRLKELTDALRRQALEDPLTGLATRRRFEPQLHHEVARSARCGEPLGLLMVDVDHFKRFNDSAGHAAGDDALRQVARALCGATRSGDLAARLGGEEFVLLLPATGLEGAVQAGERVLAGVAALRLPHPGLAAGAMLSVSVGAAAWRPHGVRQTSRATETELARQLLETADRALYAAKHQGRNRVCAQALEAPEPAA